MASMQEQAAEIDKALAQVEEVEVALKDAEVVVAKGKQVVEQYQDQLVKAEGVVRELYADLHKSMLRFAPIQVKQV